MRPTVVSILFFIPARLAVALLCLVTALQAASPTPTATTSTKSATVETRRPPESVFTPPIDPAKAPKPSGPLTLLDCYQLAVIRSDTLGLREQEVKHAQALYWQAVGTILPNIHLLSSEGLQNGGSTPGGPAVDKDNAFYSRVNVKQPIFRGFGDIYAASASKADIESRRYDRERTFQTLYLDTATVYYQILGYQADLGVLAQLQKALEERIVELDRRIKIGRSKRSELLLAQTTLAQTRVAIEQVRGLLAATKEMLAFLVGWPSSQITLAQEGPLPGSQALENYLLESGERPDILALLANMHAETKRLSVARAARSPSFTFEGNYYTVQDPAAPGNWNMFIVCDLPLFDGTIEPRVSQQKAVLRASELNLEELRRTTDREVRTAYLNFNTSISEYARLKETEEFAGENYAAQMSDYQLGRVTNLDVLDALQRLHAARRDSVGASTDARINLVRLHVAAGQLSRSVIPTAQKAGQP